MDPPAGEEMPLVGNRRPTHSKSVCHGGREFCCFILGVVFGVFLLTLLVTAVVIYEIVEKVNQGNCNKHK